MTKSLQVKDDIIHVQPLNLRPADYPLSDEEIRMLEAGFEAVSIPLEHIPLAAGQPGSTRARVQVAGRNVKFSSLKQVDIILLELNSSVQEVSAFVGLNEFLAPVPYMPSPVRKMYARAAGIMPGQKSYVLFLPEWQPSPRDPIAFYGDLSRGYLWKVGQWNGFEEAKVLEARLRKTR